MREVRVENSKNSISILRISLEGVRDNSEGLVGDKEEGRSGGKGLHVSVAVLSHEILDVVVRRVAGCVSLAVDACLEELCSRSVWLHKCGAKFLDGKVISPNEAIGSLKHFLLYSIS